MSSRRRLVTLGVACGLVVGTVAAPGSVAHAVPAPTVALPTTAGANAILRTAVSFDGGQLLADTRYGNGTGSLDTWPVIDVPTGSVDLAAVDTVESDAAASTSQDRRFAVSGDIVVTTTSDEQVHVTRKGVPVFTVPAPAAGLHSVDASGPYVRIGTDVYDSRRSETAPIYTAPAASRAGALFGSYVAFGDVSGKVLLKDVASSAAAVVANPGTPGCLTCTPVVRIDGSTVASGRSGAVLTLYGIDSKATTANALSLSSATTFWLGNGRVFVGGPSGVAFHDLTSTSTVSAVASSYLTGAVTDLDVDGNDVAYVLRDGTGFVAHLPAAFDGPKLPAFLTGTVPKAFSPNGDDTYENWSTTFYFTRSISAYTLSISNGDQLGSAVLPTSTSILPVWAPGSWTPDGLYSWQLVTTNGDGDAPPIVGTVRVRRTNPQKASLTAPRNVATASSSTSTKLTWTAGGFPSGVTAVSYDIAYRRVSISAGRRVYGATTTLLSRTTKQSTTFAGAKGATYDFRVRVWDSVGLAGPWSSWNRSNIPLDDRSSALTYGKGWKSEKKSGRWAGTDHVATSAKRAVSVTQSGTSGFALVMSTCKKCGWVKVYVDGKFKRTVSLYSSATKNRRQVYSVAFRKLGKHTVKLVTVATRSRTRTYLDAVLVLH